MHLPAETVMIGNDVSSDIRIADICGIDSVLLNTWHDTEEEIRQILTKLDDEDTYGFILRSKGMVPDPEGRWIHFDYVPEETEVRYGAADVTGKICVIGSGLKEEAIADLFRK